MTFQGLSDEGRMAHRQKFMLVLYSLVRPIESCSLYHAIQLAAMGAWQHVLSFLLGITCACFI